MRKREREVKEKENKSRREGKSEQLIYENGRKISGEKNYNRI